MGELVAYASVSSWLMMFQTSVRPWSGMLGSLAMSSRVLMAFALRTSIGLSFSLRRALICSAARRMLRGTEVSSISMSSPLVMFWIRVAMAVSPLRGRSLEGKRRPWVGAGRGDGSMVLDSFDGTGDGAHP